MKKLLFLFSLMFAFVACQSDANQVENLPGEEADAVIVVATPLNQDFRSPSLFSANINSTKGGVSNVDKATYKLRYILEITTPSGVKLPRQMQVVDLAVGSTVAFNVRLVMNTKYKFTAWADFVTDATGATDKHYNTSDLTAIEMVAASRSIINDDSKDAYAYYGEVNASPSIGLTLKRPLAKVRYISTDFTALAGIGEAITQIDFKYADKINSKYNAITGVVSDLVDVAQATPVTELDNDASVAATEKTLFWDYVFVPKTGTFPIGFAMTCTTDAPANRQISVPVTSGVVLKKNALTTIKHNSFTAASGIILSVDENFDNPELKPEISAIKIEGSATTYTTIADAMSAAVAGQTILVPSGSFDEDITIKEDVKVVGVGATTIIGGQISLATKSVLKDITSYYNGTARNAVELKGENLIVDGVTFITDRKRGTGLFNGEAVHADNSVKNLIIQNCIFNTLESKNYWKGVYLNRDNNLQVLNNIFLNLNPFGIDNFDTGIVVKDNTFDRSSWLGNDQMIHLAAVNLTISDDPATWTTGVNAILLANVKQIKAENTWKGSQLTSANRKPVRVQTTYYGGDADDATWLKKTN